MDRIRRFIRIWLGFSRTETNGFLILLPLLLIIIISKPVYQSLRSGESFIVIRDTTLRLQVAQWDAAIAEKPAVEKVVMRSFDPNKEPVEGLISLGFTERLATRIAAYRSKGGVFRVKRDLMKIYGMDSTLYTQMQPHINLPFAIPVTVSKAVTTSTPIAKKSASIISINLNTADTSTLMSMKGIGRILSKRIIRFRESLGGFSSEDQLFEVYGLDSALVNSLKSHIYVDASLKKININTADELTLAAHPYIKKKLAASIAAYRFQHGKFNDVNDIRKLPLIAPLLAEKLIPYLTVTD